MRWVRCARTPATSPAQSPGEPHSFARSLSSPARAVAPCWKGGVARSRRPVDAATARGRLRRRCGHHAGCDRSCDFRAGEHALGDVARVEAPPVVEVELLQGDQLARLRLGGLANHQAPRASASECLYPGLSSEKSICSRARMSAALLSSLPRRPDRRFFASDRRRASLPPPGSCGRM